MNIAPTPEFQQAFKHVTGLDCTPSNVITTIRENRDLFQQVREAHADIVMLASQRRLVTELTATTREAQAKQARGAGKMNEIAKRKSTTAAHRRLGRHSGRSRGATDPRLAARCSHTQHPPL